MKYCTKCYRRTFYRKDNCCHACGTKLVSWDLMCKCGILADVTMYKSFGQLWFATSHCANCGADLRPLIKAYIKQLKKEERNYGTNKITKDGAISYHPG